MNITSQTATLTNITRKSLMSIYVRLGLPWWGCLDEIEFLNRLYELDDMPSTDMRFKNATGDIWQHRKNNFDWEDDWVFYDERFSLLSGPDEEFLKFLCETVHPEVCPDFEQSKQLVAAYNEHLKYDNWELLSINKISGRSIYSARRTSSALGSENMHELVQLVDTDYIKTQVSRMEEALKNNDVELAIGASKELIETTCKTILRDRNVIPNGSWDLPKLVYECMSVLNLSPEKVTSKDESDKVLRNLLGSLQAIVNNTATLRRLYGTGHGKEANFKGLEIRHARLAMGCAVNLATFLYESHIQG